MLDDKQLAQLQIFKDVKPDQVRNLMKDCPIVSFKKGEVILEPGKVTLKMYILLDGQVSVRLNNPEKTPISMIYKGESIGEMSAHDGKDPSAVVRAETDANLVEVSDAKLFELIEANHTIARNLLYLMADRLRKGNQKMQSQMGFRKPTPSPQ